MNVYKEQFLYNRIFIENFVFIYAWMNMICCIQREWKKKSKNKTVKEIESNRIYYTKPRKKTNNKKWMSFCNFKGTIIVKLIGLTFTYDDKITWKRKKKNRRRELVTSKIYIKLHSKKENGCVMRKNEIKFVLHVFVSSKLRFIECES